MSRLRRPPRHRPRAALIVGVTLLALATAGVGWAWAAWSTTTQLTGAATAGFVHPLLQQVPEITGTPADGETLTVVPGQWSGLAPGAGRSYAWTRCTTLDQSACTTVATGANSITVPSGVTANWRYAVTETITNGTQTATASSVPTPAQTPFAATVLGLITVRLMAATTVQPAITGTAQVGATLTASNGTWITKDLLSSLTGALGLGSPVFSYQWYRCGSVGNPSTPNATAPLGCAAVAGATAATRTIAPADAGHRLHVRVTYQRSLIGLVGAINLGTFTGAVFAPATPVVIP